MHRFFLSLFLLLAVGCGAASRPNPTPAEVTGKVVYRGKPLDGVSLNLHPTGVGHPAVVPVKQGAFKSTVTPGTYTYFFTPGSSRAAFAQIPKAYHEGSLDRQIEVEPGAALALEVR